MSLPALTAADRSAALEKAIRARRDRSELRARLKSGNLTLSEVLHRSDEVVGRMLVRQLLTAMPGVGRVRADRLMNTLGIAEGRRVRGLGPAQRARPLAAFPDAA
jgi:hypothetical protein